MGVLLHKSCLFKDKKYLIHTYSASDSALSLFPDFNRPQISMETYCHCTNWEKKPVPVSVGCWWLTVLRQNFFELLVVWIQPGQTLQVYVLLQGRVSEPEPHKNTFFLIKLYNCVNSSLRKTCQPSVDALPLAHFSASVCCSLIPTLKCTGCTLSSMPLWISFGSASNMVPGSGMRTLKPSRFPVMIGSMSGAELPVAWVTLKGEVQGKVRIDKLE